MAALRPGPGKTFIDGTLGGGGHTRLLLDAGAQVIGFDRDEAVVARAKVWGADYTGKFEVVWGDYTAMSDGGMIPGRYTDDIRMVGVDGVLLDLGISSDQLDDPERGLSYQVDGPLDMRMDRSRGMTVADLLNTWDEKDIAQVMFDYAEEPRSRVIARAIVSARKAVPFERTTQLLKVVEQVYPLKFGLKRSHPAGRIFQAFRVAVNEELRVLEEVLPGAAALLKPGGRLVIITFQSLEERIVKRVFKELAVDELDSVGRVVKDSPYKVWKKMEPTAAEIERNPRARSAHVRVLEKL